MDPVAADVAIIRKYLDACSSMDVEAAKATFHEKMVIEAPFNPECLGVIQSIYDGKESCDQLYDSLPQIAEAMRFTNIEIEPLRATGKYVATYQGHSRMVATGRPYCNRYISLITVQDNLIIRLVEHFNGYTLLKSLGWTASPPGSNRT